MISQYKVHLHREYCDASNPKAHAYMAYMAYNHISAPIIDIC